MSRPGKKVVDVAFKASKNIDWEGMAKLLVSDEARKEFATLRRTFDEVNSTLQTKFSQPACETVMNWLSSGGVTELLPEANVQPNERFMVMREVSPLPISLLSGFSMNLYLKLVFQMEESLFAGQVVPSIAMVETYTRLLLIAPHSLFCSHFSHLAQRNASLLSKPAVTLLQKISTMTADEYFEKHPELKKKFDDEIRNDYWGY
ncbi:hypothetical protein GOBAR_AA06944 [Gossypium barbadense]|uniref:ATP synthase subunit d, mitochondrial n=1 Tax=Gossypium barbadense TaxID=3634 RepID=A0A2P5YDG6_GOSBA|nr:hypothetical protein GOBAR_AA06944 [Gossypium barbadense]